MLSDQQKIDGALATAGRLVRAIVQDVAGRPLYLVNPKPGTMMDRKLTNYWPGMFYRDLDVALRPQLESEGRWTGRGPCIVVDADMCYATAVDDDYGMRRTLGVTLHE